MKALTRAWRCQRLLDESVCTSIREIAEEEAVSRSCICRILPLTLFAPDIVECIVDGRPAPGLLEPLKPVPM